VRHPELCPPTGPGAVLARLAESGLYPVMPLPSMPLDPLLFNVPTNYLRAGNKPVRLFPSAEAAAEGSGEIGEIPKGFVYLYYTESSTGADTSSGLSTPFGNRVYRYTWDGSMLVNPVLILPGIKYPVGMISSSACQPA